MAKTERKPDPAPLQTNDVLTVAVGTAAWLVALVVLLFLHHTLEKHHTTWWYWVCLTGIGLGCVGLFLTNRRRHPRTEPQD